LGRGGEEEGVAGVGMHRGEGTGLANVAPRLLVTESDCGEYGGVVWERCGCEGWWMEGGAR
jgi:hypothetical protein